MNVLDDPRPYASAPPHEWVPTGRLRQVMRKGYGTTRFLQQQWTNQYGTLEWRDVPTERESEGA